MKDFFKNIKDKNFLISIFCMLGLQMLTYVSFKFFQTNYHTFNFYIDEKIPFVPQVIIIYNLFYPVVFLAFYSVFNKDQDLYYKGIIAGILGFIMANIIFLIYPVEMIRPDISNLNIDPINNYILSLTYKLDSPAINCFPSVHCIFCFVAMYIISKVKNIDKIKKVLINILLLMIALSTVLVKQHYLVDGILALIIVIVSIIITNIFFKKIFNSYTIFPNDKSLK